MRWILSLIRRWRLRNELYDDKPDQHPALKGLEPGEVFPWKGTLWRVASIREAPLPCVILVPIGETLASRVHHLQKLRRVDRILTHEEVTIRASMNKRAGGA